MGCSHDNSITILNNNLHQNQNNDNSNNNKIKITKSFGKYTMSEVKELYQNFIKTDRMVTTFYDIETKDDPIFNEMKSREREILTNYFQKNKISFQKQFNVKLRNAYIPFEKTKNLVSEFIEQEGGEAAFQYKIEECIKMISSNKKEYEIKYLTIMVVGKSGVGKSTLINEVLKLERGEKAKTGTGKFVTVNYTEYQSESINFLRIIDTRGIELNKNYGAEQVQRDAENFIQMRKETNDPNKFVQCIWYCFTGNRFEQVEVDLLNSLRKAYGESRIPIILIYTQATDKTAINEMKEYIKDININVDFIEVLAKKKELVNNSGSIEPFGIDVLIKETLDKCKKALNGEMFSVITDSISKKILEILEKQNNGDKEYIEKMMKLSFINNFGYFIDKDIFLQFIMHLLGFNIKIFFEKKETKINQNCQQIFRNSDFFKNLFEILIQDYENISNELNEPILEAKARYFIELQVQVQKECKGEISYKNQRTMDEFKKNIMDFMNQNYYNIAQKSIIVFIFEKIYRRITDEFVEQFDQLTKNILQKENNKELIKGCFMIKFSDFEDRLKSYQSLLSKSKAKYSKGIYNNINIYNRNRFNNFENDINTNERININTTNIYNNQYNNNDIKYNNNLNLNNNEYNNNQYNNGLNINNNQYNRNALYNNNHNTNNKYNNNQYDNNNQKINNNQYDIDQNINSNQYNNNDLYNNNRHNNNNYQYNNNHPLEVNINNDDNNNFQYNNNLNINNNQYNNNLNINNNQYNNNLNIINNNKGYQNNQIVTLNSNIVLTSNENNSNFNKSRIHRKLTY